MPWDSARWEQGDALRLPLGGAREPRLSATAAFVTQVEPVEITARACAESSAVEMEMSSAASTAKGRISQVLHLYSVASSCLVGSLRENPRTGGAGALGEEGRGCGEGRGGGWEGRG